MRRTILRLGSHGFTLIETTIVLAIISLTTITLLSSYGANSRTERFAGEVKAFANTIREAQTQSYTIQTGTPGGCDTLVPPYVKKGEGCLWRGVVLGYTVNADYTQSLLRGADLSQYSPLSAAGDGTDCSTNDIRQCIFETSDSQNVSLVSKGIYLSKISFGPNATNSLDLAFLAPSGQAYNNCQNFVAGSCITDFNSVSPYSNSELVTFELSDSTLTLKGTVTFDPASGTIKTTVQ